MERHPFAVGFVCRRFRMTLIASLALGEVKSFPVSPRVDKRRINVTFLHAD